MRMDSFDWQGQAPTPTTHKERLLPHPLFKEGHPQAELGDK
jgi:hypothetical protein